RHCACDVAILRQITLASHDSVLLALEALREGRDRDAHEFAYEAWGLRHTPEAAAIGLLAAAGLGDPVEIPRWMRRRRAMNPPF
ncbi:MAG: hypothetical protein JWL81_2600, partial [Verrucomicrobiales bacterium]|nr:hypothetical protein [Verrucomicrobiales bacterium]